MKPRNSLRIVLRILSGFITVFSFAAAIFFGGRTLTDLWQVWATDVVAALTSGIGFWRVCRPLTATRGFLINYLIYAVCFTGISTGTFFALNYAFSDSETAIVTEGEIVRAYSETRYHSRRVGRRLTGRGTPYKVYFADLSLPKGKMKTISLTLEQYNRARKGSRMKLEVEQGLFGLPVFKHTSLMRKNSSSPRSHHHSRR